MKFVFLLVLTILLPWGCAKDSSDSSKVTALSELSADTCNVTRPGGKVSDGMDGKKVLLYRQYLAFAIQKLYNEGEFPQSYAVGISEHKPSKAELLAKGTSWKWSIEPAKDAEGKWSLLRIYKEIWYPVDDHSYELETQTFNYGDSIEVRDGDTGILIQCLIPKDNP